MIHSISKCLSAFKESVHKQQTRPYLKTQLLSIIFIFISFFYIILGFVEIFGSRIPGKLYQDDT